MNPNTFVPSEHQSRMIDDQFLNNESSSFPVVSARIKARQSSYGQQQWSNNATGIVGGGGGGSSNRDGQQYEDMVAQKLTELQAIQQQKIRALEQGLQEKDNEIAAIQDRFAKLEEEFNFNLAVIEERDNDMDELKSKMIQLREVCEEKSSEIAALRSNAEAAEKSLDDVKQRMSEKNRHLYEKIDELKSELKFQRSTYTQELLKSKELATQLASIEGNLAEKSGFMEKQHMKVIEEIRAAHAEEIAKVQKQYFDLQNQRGYQTAEIQQQNERLLKQTEELLAERTQLKQHLLEKDRQMQQEINTCNTRVQEAILLAQHAQQEAATLKHASSNWDDVMKERIGQVQQEKENLAEQFAQHKAKSKSKLNSIRDESERKLDEIVKEYSSKAKRTGQELRDMQSQCDFLSLSEKHLKERMTEMQVAHRREVDEIEQRYVVQMRNAEEDKRQARNESELKTFQLNQVANELEREAKAKSRLEQEVFDLVKQNEDLQAEVQLLIQELVVFRKQTGTTGKAKRKNNNNNNNEDMDDASFERILKEDLRPVEDMHRIKELESEVATYKGLIDSMSYEMESVKQKLQLNNQELRMSREECMELRNRVSECKLDAVSYRERLQRLELENKEMSAQLADQRTFEQITATVRLKDEVIKELKDQVERLTRDLMAAKRERDALTGISSGLKSKCMDLEDRLAEYNDVDPVALTAQNSIQIKQLREMAEQLDKAEQELSNWQRVDYEKDMVIESLRTELMKYNQLVKAGNAPALSVVSHYNHMKRQEVLRKQQQQNQNNSPDKEGIPKYDAFQEIGANREQQHLRPVRVGENDKTAANRYRSPFEEKEHTNNTAQAFRKQLISLYDHINPDSHQFIEGRPENNNGQVD